MKGLEEIKRADEAPRAPEEAKMSPKERQKTPKQRLPTIEETIVPRSSVVLWRREAPGAPSRARGILDKSSKEIYNIDLSICG